jgi:hypothetical protein
MICSSKKPIASFGGRRFLCFRFHFVIPFNVHFDLHFVIHPCEPVKPCSPMIPNQYDDTTPDLLIIRRSSDASKLGLGGGYGDLSNVDETKSENPLSNIQHLE